MNVKVKKDQENHREMLLMVTESLKYFLRQGLATRGHEEIEGNLMQLLLLQAKHCSKLKHYIDNKYYLLHKLLLKLLVTRVKVWFGLIFQR